MSNERIVAAFVRSAPNNLEPLARQEARLRAAARREGQTIGQVFYDLEELRGAVAEGGISTLWIASIARFGLSWEGYHMLDSLLGAKVKMRMLESDETNNSDTVSERSKKRK